MIDADYNSAVAIKAELQQINALLANDPVKPAYTFHGELPKEDSIQALAQTALNTANAGWEGVLNTRKTALETAFTALGEG